jgi:hypothetical protein
VSDAGLYGAQDPTYDGVYRQSMAILGLRANGYSVPASAISWLTKQQCANGSFTAYRSNTAKPCPAVNLVTYSGPDSNSTATAVMALKAVGRTAQAKRALAWLRANQLPNGGFEYFSGLGADANSTGLAIGAARALGVRSSKLQRNGGRTAAQYLSSVQLGCAASPAKRGALAFQRTGSILIASDFASAQAGAALSSNWAALGRSGSVRSSVPALSCSGSTAWKSTDLVAGYLARRLTTLNGKLPNAFGPGTSWDATAWAALTLSSRGLGKSALSTTVKALRANVNAYVVESGKDRPGALGTLLLVARSTGSSTTSFGSANLVQRLRATLRG